MPTFKKPKIEIAGAVIIFTAMASHSNTQADRDAAAAALQAELNKDPTATDLRADMLTAGTYISQYTDAIAHLRMKEGYTIQTTVSAVPVPGAVWLFGSAIATFVGLGGRRKKSITV